MKRDITSGIKSLFKQQIHDLLCNQWRSETSLEMLNILGTFLNESTYQLNQLNIVFNDII